MCDSVIGLGLGEFDRFRVRVRDRVRPSFVGPFPETWHIIGHHHAGGVVVMPYPPRDLAHYRQVKASA